jgi:hypothetical protein
MRETPPPPRAPRTLAEQLTQMWTAHLAWREVDHRRPLSPREHRPCPICGGPMLSVDLPPGGGRHTQENHVAWRRCGSCGRHQEGEPLRRNAA